MPGWLDFLFPKTCLGCGRWGSYLCEECMNKLSPLREPICPECRRVNYGGETHSRCFKRASLAGLTCVYPYVSLAKKLVTNLKYKFVSDLVVVMGELMISNIDWDGKNEPWMVTAVPLHPSREKWRGFNQARELGKQLAKGWGYEYEEGLVRRVRKTKPQMSLRGKERGENLKKAFAGGLKLNRFKGKNIILVDDVWTTGTTMNECARALKGGGVKRVWGITFARALRLR